MPIPWDISRNREYKARPRHVFFHLERRLEVFLIIRPNIWIMDLFKIESSNRNNGLWRLAPANGTSMMDDSNNGLARLDYLADPTTKVAGKECSSHSEPLYRIIALSAENWRTER